MPFVANGNVHTTVLMIASRAAEMILKLVRCVLINIVLMLLLLKSNSNLVVIARQKKSNN